MWFDLGIGVVEWDCRRGKWNDGEDGVKTGFEVLLIPWICYSLQLLALTVNGIVSIV
jgi:hypothetical protein